MFLSVAVCVLSWLPRSFEHLCDLSLSLSLSLSLCLSLLPALSTRVTLSCLRYDTGEAVVVEFQGTAEDASVRLEKTSVRAESTPITRESRKEIRIQNRSGVMVKFCWKAVATVEEEEQLLSRLTRSIDEKEDAETDEFARMLEADPLQRTQAAVLRRTYASLRQSARDAPNSCVMPAARKRMNKRGGCECLSASPYQNYQDYALVSTLHASRTRMRFGCSSHQRTRGVHHELITHFFLLTNARYEDDVFRIEPSSGEIWPDSEAIVTVVFAPKEATQYTRTVYCDVTGRETRLPLKLRGDGLGPVLEFPTREVDMGRMFVGSTHVFEVVARNTSVVEAIYRFVRSEQRHAAGGGRTLTMSPREGVVQPGGHQAFSVVFTSTVVGAVDDEVVLHVEGAAPGTEPSVRFVGSVIAPTFRLASEEFNFGSVPWGFPTTRQNTLYNTSLVPIELRCV